MYRMLVPVYRHASYAKSGLELFYVDWEEVTKVRDMAEARHFAQRRMPWIHNFVLEDVNHAARKKASRAGAPPRFMADSQSE